VASNSLRDYPATVVHARGEIDSTEAEVHEELQDFGEPDPEISMRVAVYDKNPGAGFAQSFLALTWRIGCFLHKLFGKLDAYHAATSWEDAFAWLHAQPKPLASIQYWGHGSPARIWLAGKAANAEDFIALKPKLAPSAVIWFRVCSAFRGIQGHAFSQDLADNLGCTIAGHTRIIGVFQSGLHTRAPNTEASWPVTEDEFPKSIWSSNGLKRGNNTIFCLRASIPKGW
jgi:hypothetical protein